MPLLPYIRLRGVTPALRLPDRLLKHVKRFEHRARCFVSITQPAMLRPAVLLPVGLAAACLFGLARAVGF